MAEIKAEVVTPQVPNFLRVKLPGQEKGSTVPISEFTDEQLAAVGKAWTDRLLALAMERRGLVAAGPD